MWEGMWEEVWEEGLGGENLAEILAENLAEILAENLGNSWKFVEILVENGLGKGM